MKASVIRRKQARFDKWGNPICLDVIAYGSKHLRGKYVVYYDHAGRGLYVTTSDYEPEWCDDCDDIDREVYTGRCLAKILRLARKGKI